MSTYLVAWLVSDLEETRAEATTSDARIQVSVLSRADQRHLAVYPANTARRILEQYEMLYGIQYPLEKLHLVAIPDFAAGAMENWGLITFRETDLLYDKSISSELQLERVVTVIAHELAHQWFGNLVTMNWWNDLWLNEGFATFMEYVGVHSILPEWKMMDRLYADDTMMAFKFDAYQSTHALSSGSIKTNLDIYLMFDSISYSKGASLIRMLRDWVDKREPSGKNGYFMSRIQAYLQQHAYGNAQTADLWGAINGPHTGDIPRIAGTWTQQSGYPVVRISRDGSSRLKFTASRFSITTKDGKADWLVPLTIAVVNGKTKATRTETALLNGSAPFSLEVDSEEKVLLNAHRVGYYRCLYDTDVAWDPSKTKSGLLDAIAHPVDKAGLLEDAMALSFTNQVSVTSVLDQAYAFRTEGDAEFWGIALIRLRQIVGLMGKDNFPRTSRFVLFLIRPYLNEALSLTFGPDAAVPPAENIDMDHMSWLRVGTFLSTGLGLENDVCIALSTPLIISY